jgi:pyrroloquinoline-quinone synthase
MSLIARLDDLRRRRNILEHPFYTRWERGELSRSELSAYAEHAAEERGHVALWDHFANDLGADLERAPRAETEECATAWTSAQDPLEALAILYAIEAGQPEVSQTKLDGLVEHYGFEARGDGTAYFRLHAERDHEHAAHSRELLEGHVTPADEDRLVAAAERALVGNWRLLDGLSG